MCTEYEISKKKQKKKNDLELSFYIFCSTLSRGLCALHSDRFRSLCFSVGLKFWIAIVEPLYAYNELFACNLRIICDISIIISRYPLPIREGFDQGNPLKYFPPETPKLNELHVALPSGVICDRCVLQWTYTVGV